MTALLRSERKRLAKGRRRRGVVDATLLALDQRPNATLSEIAKATDSPVSSAQTALKQLQELGTTRERGGRYELLLTEELRPGALYLSSLRAGRDHALQTLVRAVPALNLAVLDKGQNLHLVYGPTTDSNDLERLKRRLRQLFPEIRVVDYEADSYAGRTVEVTDRNEQIRDHLAQGNVILGSVSRSFPLPPRSQSKSQLLGKLHPSLPVLSRRGRQSLAQRFGLAEISAFGSATRSDFRSDSDVDILVRFRQGVRPSLSALADLRREFESHFGRRVDVVTDESLDERMRRSVEQGKVRIYGKSHAQRVAPAAG